MVLTILLCCALWIVVVYPIWANWATLKANGILRRALVQGMGLTLVITNSIFLVNLAQRWSELGRKHESAAADHLLKSPLTGASLIGLMIGAALLFLLPNLFPVKKGSGTDALPMEYDLPVAASEYPEESLSPDYMRRLLLDQLERLPQQRLESPFLHGHDDAATAEDLQRKRAHTMLCSCHEAGHALFFVLRGATIKWIAILAGLHMDIKSAEPISYGGMTDWSGPERECTCGGYVRALRGKERDAHGSDAYQIQFGPDCAACLQYAVEYIATLYAGNAATELLMPDLHDPRYRVTDDVVVAQFFHGLPGFKKQKADILGRAEILSREIVGRETKAIKALTKTLALTDGPLAGNAAEKVIRDNLVSNRLLG